MRPPLLAIGVLGLVAASALAAPADQSLRLTQREPASEVEAKLAEFDQQERRMRNELRELDQQVLRAEKLTRVRGRAYTRLARAGLLPVSDGFQSLVKHATRLERLRRGLERDLREQRAALAKKAALNRRLDRLSGERLPLEVEFEALRTARDALLSARDRERAFAQAFGSQAPVSHAAVYGAGWGPTDASEAGFGFSAMKGRLPFPLAGRTEIVAARRRGADGPGLEMLAPSGTVVRAVYAGRVAFADEYSDYGKTIIVDHGDNHYSVSANLGSLEARVGDDVSAGTRLGTVGDRGDGAKLYFEIRVGSDTVDPTVWFGI